ncbi:MAG: peptide-methionine (R)-S-oxide reductase MsrB [Candidatus Thermoplasmatota archaeon]|nr:peptide-methionine (R)-S-oxide reductase MsrB [Candidatus Thermoplasmatota archaeon]
MAKKIEKTKEQWKKDLTPEQYHVLREKGTESPFTGEYYHNKETGTYLCAGCGSELFSSEHKYDSGSGWPSFFLPLRKENIEEKEDPSFFMTRTEIRCAGCGGHLGHVFDDGPDPTGLRYCVNSASLKFRKE